MCSYQSFSTITLTEPDSFESSIAAPEWRLKGIVEHPSYHGAITGKEAMVLLKKHGSDCYLLRYSKIQDKFMILVFKRIKGKELCSQFQLIVTEGEDNNRYEIKGAKKEFTSISRLLEHYQCHPISPKINRLGDICVKNSK